MATRAAKNGPRLHRNVGLPDGDLGETKGDNVAMIGMAVMMAIITIAFWLEALG